MTMLTIPEAQANLPETVEHLGPGEEIILIHNQRPVARLTSIPAAPAQPVFGGCRGKLTIVAEDEEHLQDFKDYVP